MTVAALTPAQQIERRREEIRKFAHLMDAKFAVPGTKVTFGIDPIIGLIPAAGSIISMLISIGIVVEGVRFGARGWTLAVMLFNLLADAVIGAIPVLGTAFDIFYKANTRNVRLLDSHLVDPTLAKTGARRGAITSLLVIGAFVTIVSLVVIALFGWLLIWLIGKVF